MRIAIWTERAWALGRIHEEIIRCIPEHLFTFFDWRSIEDCEKYFATYQSYDILLGNTAILFLSDKFGIKLQPNYLWRTLAVLHCPVLNHEFYDERVPFKNGPEYLGVSPQCCVSIGTDLHKPVKVCPFGINPMHFPKGSAPKNLRVAGVTALNVHKNCDLVRNICKRANLELIVADNTKEHKDLYPFDVFLCASTLDAGPLGNFEAAALGIPVLSTRVGNWAYVKDAIFFETEDEALSILSRWKAVPEERIAYAERVRDEIHSKWTNDILIRTHLLPVLDSFGTCIDLLDIGAMHSGSRRSIHVDPRANPDKHNGIVEYAALVETPLEPVVYFSTRTSPEWIQGCARIGQPHPACLSKMPDHTMNPQKALWYASERATQQDLVRIMTVKELVLKYRLRFIDELSLVVEGYEVYILQALLREVQSGLAIRKLKILWNELTNDHEKSFCKYLLRDYTLEVCGSFLTCTLL